MTTENDIQIDYLAKHPEWIDTLTGWFFDEWPAYYADKSTEDVAESFRQRLNVDRIPLTLIAHHDGEVIGTVSLKEHDMDIRKNFSPWLAALYVALPYRRRGIGTLLIESGLSEARRLGLSHLYLWTPQLEPFYLKRGWSILERTVYNGINVSVMERDVL